MVERHLFKRVVEKKNGKKEIRWYYWFYDENGKQVKKSCGQHGKPCLLKREAETYIAELAEKDKQEIRAKEDEQKIRLRDIGETLYNSDSPFMQLKNARGRTYLPQTINAKQTLMKIVLEKFGDRIPDTIEDSEVEDFLISLDYSNSYRNQILQVMKDAFEECKRLKIVKHKLDVDRFANNCKKKDIFTIDELVKMFPSDVDKLTEVWSNPYQKKLYIGVDGKVHNYGFMIGVMFRLMASTGLRPGECRAICIDQIRENGLLVNKMLDGRNILRHYLKTGNDNNLRQRTVLLPTKMATLLNMYVKQRPESDTDFIFSENGHFLITAFLNTYFRRILIKLGIYDGTRKLSPHSLRFTYNTYTVNSNLIPENVLRKMIGHKSEEMTDYYTRPDLDSQLEGLLPYQEMINEIWDKLD